MAANKKWAILYCPKKGMYSRGVRWSKVERSLMDNGIEFDYVQSENANSVERLITMFIENGYQTIVVVGGDSALNDAANCLMRVDKETREGIALGVIPNGLMNDFAHFWGMTEGDVDGTVKWLKKRRIRKIDLGRVRYTNKEGKNCQRYFLNCVNVGLIATIMNLRLQTSSLSHYWPSNG